MCFKLNGITQLCSRLIQMIDIIERLKMFHVHQLKIREEEKKKKTLWKFKVTPTWSRLTHDKCIECKTECKLIYLLELSLKRKKTPTITTENTQDMLLTVDITQVFIILVNIVCHKPFVIDVYSLTILCFTMSKTVSLLYFRLDTFCLDVVFFFFFWRS